jgi:hypothetical protein
LKIIINFMPDETRPVSPNRAEGSFPAVYIGRRVR